jgi:hypothetical protein
MARSIRHTTAWAGLAVVLLSILGCGKEEITITSYPSFYRGQIKTVAVAPFRNATDRPNAGNIVSDTLANQLATNGTYTVFNRNDLNVLQNEMDLRTSMGIDNAAIAKRYRAMGNVDAVLVGTVSTWDCTVRNEQRREPIQKYNSNTKTYYVAGYRDFMFTRYEANVAATAALIRVSDGTVIYATPEPVRANAWAQGSPPPRDENGCLVEAGRLLVNGLVGHFAVTRRTIEVDEGDDFRTARGLYDNEWDWEDKFSLGEEKAFIVLRMPAVCDRNRFRLTIVRKDCREDLYEKQIVWDKQYGGFGYEFNPAEVAQKGGGPGKYIAKCYSGPEPVLKHEFKIE